MENKGPNLQISIDSLNEMLASPVLAEDSKAYLRKIIRNGGKVVVVQKYINASPDIVSVLSTEAEMESFIHREEPKT